LLTEERGDDADDQRRLQPFPEADHEGRQHLTPALLSDA
jgi:hypothetical protein